MSALFDLQYADTIESDIGAMIMDMTGEEENGSERINYAYKDAWD